MLTWCRVGLVIGLGIGLAGAEWSAADAAEGGAGGPAGVRDLARAGALGGDFVVIVLAAIRSGLTEGAAVRDECCGHAIQAGPVLLRGRLGQGVVQDPAQLLVLAELESDRGG
jgi:hypothetical protein